MASHDRLVIFLHGIGASGSAAAVVEGAIPLRARVKE